MNRPDSTLTFMADKHSDCICEYNTMRIYGQVVAEYLVDNPEGIEFKYPFKFFSIIAKKMGIDHLRKTYQERDNLQITNDHTDGHRLKLSHFFHLKSPIWRYYYVRPNKYMKRKMFECAKDGRWLNLERR